MKTLRLQSIFAQITCYVLPYLTEKPLFSMEQQAAHFAECPVVTN